MGARLIHVEDPRKLAQGSTLLSDGRALNERDIQIWRFAYWLERSLLARVRQLRDSQPNSDRHSAILDYAFRINSDVFFKSTVAQRVMALYTTYQDFRHLTASASRERAGSKFRLGDEVDSDIPKEIFKETFYQHKHYELHAACWLEHRARLSLLKAAVDYLSYKAGGSNARAEGSVLLGADATQWSMIIQALFPVAFRRTLDEISKEPAFRRYPVLWQWFLGVFGGFILLDYEDQELDCLARKSRVPREEVKNGLSVFDKLFPVSGGWLRKSPSSNIKFLMLYPSSMKGIGAHYRLLNYTDDGKYGSLDLTGIHTAADLRQWNNAAVHILDKSS